jgi:hypothetical protein
VAGEDTDRNVPLRSGRFAVQPVGTTGSPVVLDVFRPEAPVIVDGLAFGIYARPHGLALEPGGKRIVMTGGGTLVGGVYLIDMDPATGRLQPARVLPSTASGFPAIRFDRDEGPHGGTGPAFAHGAVFSRVNRGRCLTRPDGRRQRRERPGPPRASDSFAGASPLVPRRRA